MCGITGIYQFWRPVSQGLLDRFTDSLAHRGPDGRGVHIDANLGLGHRRLAILDTSDAGACPMRYDAPDGRVLWISYNGEVYNFLELRRDLEDLGHRFRTQTDTEVVLAAYAQWGPDCLLKFNGMWAFALWNQAERTLFLARDRFGIKPLYYASFNGTFAFASEIKAFLTLDLSLQLNERVAPLALQSSYAYEGQTDETLLAGVKRLPAGHTLTIDDQGKGEMRRWWNTADHVPQVPDDYTEQVARFREIFADAVKIRLRSDIPVGTCLSGGVDSSAVASMMHRLYGNPASGLERCARDWQHAFVADFPGTMLDEREYAEEVANHIGVKPHYWLFDERDALASLIDSVWSMEDVYGGVAVPIWCLYREMRRRGTYVSLDGHGGDELLCGYGWYLDWPMKDVNQNLYRDFHTTLLPSILRNYDRCSMAHGIEVRMPIMDWRLVTLAFGLPAESKIGNGFTKRILRDALLGIMPEKNRVRQSKIGFNSPMVEWFNGGLAPLLTRVMKHPLWLRSPYWNGAELGAQCLGKTAAKGWTDRDWGDTLQVWTLVNLVLWQLLFIEKLPPETLVDWNR